MKAPLPSCSGHDAEGWRGLGEEPIASPPFAAEALLLEARFLRSLKLQDEPASCDAPNGTVSVSIWSAVCRVTPCGWLCLNTFGETFSLSADAAGGCFDGPAFLVAWLAVFTVAGSLALALKALNTSSLWVSIDKDELWLHCLCV